MSDTYRNHGIHLFKGLRTICGEDRTIFFFKDDLRIISSKKNLAIEGLAKIKTIEDANLFIEAFGLAWKEYSRIKSTKGSCLTANNKL